MKASRPNWRTSLQTPLIVLALALVGYAVDMLQMTLLLVFSVLVVYWAWQVYRLERWLENSGTAPPEARGVWGRLFDHIYRLQRQSKETQGRLESSVNYLQDSLKQLRDAAIIIDQRGNISWVNDSAGALVGIELPGDVGRPLINLMRSPQLSDYLSAGDYQAPLRLPPTPEQDRCLQIEVTTFAGGDRLVFVKDVTEQYKLEVMRRDFVGNVSHELRTPLTVLKGYVETLQSLDQQIVAPIARPLAQMDMQVVRMEMLLKDLLWLSRIESIEHSDKTTSVDICDLTVELVEDLRAAWPDRPITLRHEFTGLVLGDPMELHSAVSNLVVNALKYSAPASEVVIEWVLQEGRPTLSIIDKGEGIDPVHIPRLTERFYRVDKSRSQKTGGTGLGLAIVKHVALSHNAELVIESKLGEGSRFSLVFDADAKFDEGA